MATMIGNTAKRLIHRQGKFVTYLRYTEGTYNPATSMVENSSETLVPNLKAYKAEVSYRESMSPHLIGKQACAFLIAGLDINFVPQVGDYIDDGEKNKITMVIPTEYVNGVALWRLVCLRT